MEHSTFLPEERNIIKIRVLLAWIVGFAALSIAGWLSSLLVDTSILGSTTITLLKAGLMTMIVLSGILSIQRVTGNQRINIGLKTPGVAFIQFFAGIGIILIPLVLSILFTEIFGWGEIQFNMESGFLKTIALGLLVTFLFEAFPEEILFRGYIYSHLNVKFSKWLSGLVTIGLFVMLPIILSLFHKYILGQEMYIGGSYNITTGYVISIIFFGFVVQYLRVLSGAVWLGMGFHLAFVHINHLIGPTGDKLIQITEMANEQPVQMVFVGSIICIVLLLLLYPKLKKRPINWKGLNPS